MPLSHPFQNTQFKMNAVIKPTSDAFKSLKYYAPSSNKAIKKQSNFIIGRKNPLKDNYKTTNAAIANLPLIDHANFISGSNQNSTSKENTQKFSNYLSLISHRENKFCDRLFSKSRISNFK